MNADHAASRAGPRGSAPVFRFAPSPNGLLHAGHALSALLNAALAQRTGGRFLLRVEDIDFARATPELEAAMLRDLRWLGLDWEEPVRRQSEHMADYRMLLERLRGEGLVYPAFMSRGEIRAYAAAHEPWPRDPDGAPLYPGIDRELSEAERQRRIGAGTPFAWRLDMAEALRRVSMPLAWREWKDATLETWTHVAAEPAAWGDLILARRDLPTSYHLSVVTDDAGQGVTHVVRGRDLFAATAVHRLLQRLLGLPEPTYLHHRLVLGEDGRKLSKSEGAMSLAALRETGAGPEDVRALVGLSAAAARPRP